MMGVQAVRVKIVLFLVVMSIFGPSAVWASFPEKPIPVLVGWPPGSQNDMIDRAIAQSVQRILGQPVIVQNVPGGGGALVLGRIRTKKPDGYTLFQTGTAMYSRTPHLRPVPYDPLKDFAYLGQHAMFQFSIVDRADNPWKDFDGMIVYARNNPNKVKYATAGVGTPMHLVMEYLAMRENIQWIHVPFTGITEALAAMLGGHVQVHSTSTGLSDLEHIRTGRVRFLLSTTPQRSPGLSPTSHRFWKRVMTSRWSVEAAVDRPAEPRKKSREIGRGSASELQGFHSHRRDPEMVHAPRIS